MLRRALIERGFSGVMARFAFIFPGQGSQYLGMGKETHDAFASARDIFVEADKALGFRISDVCFHGSDEDLKLTRNTQPAILTVSIAILRVLEERGLRPDYVAGHSLGEYSALVCAGALKFADAVKIVWNRGKYMQEAVPAGKGAMAAVLGLDVEAVREACREASEIGIVGPANLNAPDQIVIAGEVEAVRNASERARDKGAKRVMPLPVSAPFHCDLMAPARDRLASHLKTIEFRDLQIPLINNADVLEIRKGSAARDSLVRQVCAPVRWIETIQYLVEVGVDRFVEVGPGKVLSALVKKIAPNAATCNVEGIRGIEALASSMSGAKM